MEPGTRLGRFVVEGPPLGRGDTGVVYPATDTGTGKPVAVKVLHEHLWADAGARRQLQVHAGAAARIEHPAVLRVLGLWSDQGSWLLVTERVDGSSLEDVLAQATMPPPAVAALGAQIAGALEAAHAAGVVHGDLRPGNVLVGSHGAMVFDFGFGSESLARPGVTPPEVQGGGRPGVASDLYGLGVILYHALWGRPPFAGPTPWAALGAQRQDLVIPGGPAGLARLIGELLDPDPSRRPPDAASVRVALERLTRRPDRRVRIARRWIAPVRIGSAWLVYGRDPTTAAPALVAADLSRREAVLLTYRLRRHGWRVWAAREGLGAVEVVTAFLAAAVGFVVLPIVGAPILGGAALWWQSRRARPELRSSLPVVQAPLPVSTPPAPDLPIIAIGLLLVATALLLLVFPPAAIVSGAALVAAVVGPWREARRDLAGRALEARVRAALADAWGALESYRHPLDDLLAIQGELHALEVALREGDLDEEQALEQAESLAERARSGTWVADARTALALHALRRPQRDLDGAAPMSQDGSAAGGVENPGNDSNDWGSEGPEEGEWKA